MREYDESTPHREAAAATRAVSPKPATARHLIAQRLAQPAEVLDMQRLAGNAATVQLLSSGSAETQGWASVQRDADDPAPGTTTEDAATASQSQLPTLEEFEASFSTDAVVSQMAAEGASDLAEPETPTAQALFLQRDPPPAAPAPQPAAPASPATTPATPATRPGNAGDVLSALAAEPPVKAALETLKADVMGDWKKLMDTTSPLEKTVVFTIAGALAAGAVGGVMSKPDSRAFVLDKLNGAKIPLPSPGLPPNFSLSITPQIAKGQVQGGTVGLQVKF